MPMITIDVKKMSNILHIAHEIIIEYCPNPDGSFRIIRLFIGIDQFNHIVIDDRINLLVYFKFWL